MEDFQLAVKCKNKPWLLVLAKAVIWTFIFVLLMGLIMLGVMAGWGWHQWRQFSTSANINLTTVKEVLTAGWEYQLPVVEGRYNLLLLGTDSLAGRGDDPVLTDTMMLVSINLETGRVTTLSLPRDLYSTDYQTRINALYVYGYDRYPQRPESFPEEVVSDLTGIEINHTLVLGMDQVSTVIDLVGGVEIEVPTGFVDEQFPRPEAVVATETNPEKLYKTVEFEAGWQTMSGERALEYMRSRKSGDDEGTDTARAHRQQLVIDALVSRLKQKEVLFNPSLVGQLYRFYHDNFAQEISPQELVALAKKLYTVKNQIELVNQDLKIYPDDPQGVIYHPEPRLYQNQWLYVIRDQQLFQQAVQAAL